jgi:phage-related minor tail protein
LTDAVAETARRLETLREAQRQADQQIADGVDVDQRAYRSLQAEIVRTEASLNEYETQVRNGGRTSQEVTRETEEGWTIVKDVIADLASQAIQAAIDAFGELLTQSELAFDKLQAKIGASDEAMRKYGDVAKDVFKNGWGESLADVTESIGTITNMLGDLDQVELQNVTENAMTLRDVFGWDIQESVRAANSLMDQFGLTSDEAFNLMVQGAQRGLDQNGDLLDTINEYSVQFKDAGYSADDMFNMLANGAETGTWSVDKLGDAVKEYNIRMSDGTVIEYINKNAEALGLTAAQAESLGKKMLESGGASKEAMGAILNGILSIEDPTERYKAGVGAFGTMWEDLGEEAVKALFDTKGGIDSTNASMSQVKTDAYDNLATSITALGRTLKSELLDPVVNAITPAIKGIVSWTIENMEIVKPIIIGVATAFGVLAGALAISGVISAVQKAMALLNATLLANPITLVVAAIAGLVAAIVYLWNNCDAFRNFWINVWNAIENACSAAWKAISGFFSSAWSTVTGIWKALGSFFSGCWSSVEKAFASVGSFFKNTFSNAWNAVKGVFSNWGSFFGGLWDTIKNKFSSIGTNISNAIGGAVKSGINGVISAIERTINSGVGLINGAIGLINKIPGLSVGTIGKLNLPRLASGHVAREPMIAEIGEYSGASRNPEIVTPQNILRETFDESLAKFALNNLGTSDTSAQRNAQKVDAKLDALYDIVAEYLPHLAKKTGVYVDKKRLVGELISDIDEGLGEIASRRAVSAV